jgi:serine/threonine-protein kinase
MSGTPGTIGRYAVEAELGRGSMGIVHRAHDPVMDRAVAIKTILLPHGLEEERRADFRTRFLREAQAAGRLSHPGIVTVYEFEPGPDDALPFIAMEYVDGANLHELIEREGALNPDWALGMVDTLAGGLQTAHAGGVIHRDLKPSNILVRASDGVAKIADFGVARVNQRNAGATYGSPAYTAPECIRGKAADERSDLYSLAVILYETLSGKRPFEGTTYDALCQAIKHDEPAPIRLHEPDLCPAFDRFFARALAKDPADRFQDAASLREAIAALRREQQDYSSGVSTRIVPHAAARGPAAARESSRRTLDRAAVLRRWRIIGPLALLTMLISFAAGWGLRGSRPADARLPGERVLAPAVTTGAVEGTEPSGATGPPPEALPTKSRVTSPLVGAAAARDGRPARTSGPLETAAEGSKDRPAAAPAERALGRASADAPGLAPTSDGSPTPAAAPTFVEEGPLPFEATAPEVASPSPARLDLIVRSSIKVGTLALFVDGRETYTADLAADGGKLGLALKKTLGKADQIFEARVEVPPGRHTVTARVYSAAKDKEFEDTLEIDLAAGEARALRIVAGRAIGRRVAMALD